MRKRFEQQLKLGQIPISDVYITQKSRDAMPALLTALKAIFLDKKIHEAIFKVLESTIPVKKHGRKGMDLWCIFVLSQVRMCLNISYDRLHDLACNHSSLRQIMGIETEFGYEKIKFDYYQIYDNVTLLTDDTLEQLNDIIVKFGHIIFKKKEEEAIKTKSDSFVVESDVHFPTDYNLLWDCIRKCLDIIFKMLEKDQTIEGWRKIDNWYYILKGMMRSLARAKAGGGIKKEERVQLTTEQYLQKAIALSKKIHKQKEDLPLSDPEDLALILALENYLKLLDKHIDLVDRRILKKEVIPHQEKLFSIFETYTEWIKKGKNRPEVELGKIATITSDQFNLIIDCHINENESDSQVVPCIGDRILAKYNIEKWSFDKGFFSRENKKLLELFIPKVVMPKKGKLNAQEKQEESSPKFIKTKNAHSAVESNINELEHRGLNRCPDKGYKNFKRYIRMGICAYNLHKIGKELIKIANEEEKRQKLRNAA